MRRLRPNISEQSPFTNDASRLNVSLKKRKFRTPESLTIAEISSTIERTDLRRTLPLLRARCAQKMQF